jgi:hypothetical protein
MSKDIGSSYARPSIEKFLKDMREHQTSIHKSSIETVKELLGEDVTVTDKDGNPLYDLNAALVLKQGLDIDELRQLKRLHRSKIELFEQMKNTDDRADLKILAHDVENIEFAMQKAWHFDEDRNFHEWYKVPKCTCPKMDNADWRGTDHRIIVMDCPVHGK